MKIILSSVFLGCFCFMLLGCGQSGPLYLPKSHSEASSLDSLRAIQNFF